jgi:hypothetical protein
MDNVRLHVGTTQTPLLPNNNCTIAPGQFPVKNTGQDRATWTWTVTGTNLSGPLHMILSADVDGFMPN